MAADEMAQAETLPQLDASTLVDGGRLEAEVKDMYRHVAREEEHWTGSAGNMRKTFSERMELTSFTQS